MNKRKSLSTGEGKKKKKKIAMSQGHWAGGSLTQRQEIKSLDIATVTAALTGGTARVDTLNASATGDDFNTRDGRRIMMTSVYVRGNISINIGTITGAQFGCFRYIIVYDKQFNGAEPVITDVLTASTATAHLNLNNRSRFQVIADKSYALSLSTGGPTGHSFEIFRKLNLDTQYIGTTATAASIQSGGLVHMMITDVAGATSTVRFDTRVRFLDF